MDKLFIIKTKNRFNEILIFTTKKAAQDWADRKSNV